MLERVDEPNRGGATTWPGRLLLGGLVACLLSVGGIGSTGEARAAGAIPIHRYEPPTAGDEARPSDGFGSVGYALDDDGVLWLAISLRGAAADVPHEISLVCGPTVEGSCGYRPIGTLLTGPDGDGDVFELAVPLADPFLAPFEPGERIDHITIVDPLGAPAYVSAPLRYDLP
jgi:hypothetical protein